MATQVYRVARVLTADASPVARLEAIDEDGYELRLELPALLVQRTAPGHVLVLNWSIHALPESPAVAPESPQRPIDVAHPASAASPRTVDEAFMDLMAPVRRGTPTASAPAASSTTTPTSQTRREPDLNDEFNKLLGSTRTKG